MKRLSLLFAALLLAAPVFAQSTMQQKLEARFAAADADHDGKLTPAEAQTGMPRLYAHFDEIDTAHKGYVTLAEIEQYLVQHQQ
ncbi:EF-hand domain-containing protein [Paraburkholderia sp. BCC1886]|uniref:EF-hand domain-containing protein n=1 Tax=Paraburkholderia sp. BCC1886 TaxID=2562670 RepID=UPI0011842BBD|nr:EF-hand domain-containing protein [Paraburkholderia sp. BCC1886]